MTTKPITLNVGKESSEVFDLAFDIVEAIIKKDKTAIGKLVASGFSAFDGYENILPELKEGYPELTGYTSYRLTKLIKNIIEAKKGAEVKKPINPAEL